MNERKIERKRKSRQSTLHAFFKNKGRSSTRDFMREVKYLHYATVKQDRCTDLTVPLTKTFGLGFEHIKVNVQNLIFLFN
jgi:hypothetical protein